MIVTDVAMSFDQFGNIIYVKVYVDRHTDGSEGFGLVLYKYVLLAKRVIYQMNGFQIGSKSLKVQQKRVHHNRSNAGGGGGASGEGGVGGG